MTTRFSILVILMLLLVFIIILEVASAGVSIVPPQAGVAHRWSSTSSLITPTGYHEAVLLGSNIYVIGGALPGLTSTNGVYGTSILTGGHLGKWIPVDSYDLPPIQDAASAVSAEGWIHLVGGYSFNGDTGTRLSSTYYGRPDLEGSIEWHLSIYQLLPARNLHSAVIVEDNIYLAGGCKKRQNGEPLSEVFLDEVRYSQVSSDGELLQPWQSAAHNLNTARCAHASIAFKQWIYVLGGTVANGETLTATGSVEFAQIDDGVVGSWNYGPPLPALSDLAAVVTEDGTIFVIGGQNGNLISDKVYSATIDSETGQLSSSWQNLSGDGDFVLPQKLHSHAALYANNGSIYVIGGQANPFSVDPPPEFVQDVYYIPPLTFCKSSVPSGPIPEGDVITYTISYANTSLIAQTVTITDLLPFNATLLPDTISHPGMPQGSTLVWNLGDVPPGGSGEVSFQAQVPQIPPIEPASGGAASSSDVDLVEPVPIVCATTRFLAAGVTIQPPPLPNSRNIQVTIPPGTDPSEMWLLMKGTNNVIPTVGGHPAQPVTASSINGFGASLWSASFTPTMVAGNQVVTVTTYNESEENRLNALFLFDDKDNAPFDETTLAALHLDKTTQTFPYTRQIPPGITQTTHVILPVMDISYWKDGEPDTRVTTVTVQVDDRHSSPTITNNPNLGDGLLMPKFSFVTDTSSETITSTVALTVTVVTEDSVYILGPRICWSVWIKNTAWLCSQQAGCISDTAVNPPPGVSGIYLPLILKSSP